MPSTRKTPSITSGSTTTLFSGLQMKTERVPSTGTSTKTRTTSTAPKAARTTSELLLGV